MNTKNMPAFTAQVSLYNGKAHYTGRYRREAVGGRRCEQQSTVVLPQLRGPGAPNPGDCFSDCVDKHPNWTRARCAASCRDPGGIAGSGGGKRPADADAVCLVDYGVCTAVGLAIARPDLWASCLFGGPCSCEEVRDACLSN